VAHSPLRTTHRPLAAMNHSLSDPTLSGLLSPTTSIANGHNNSNNGNNNNNGGQSPSLQSLGGNPSLAADPLSLTLRSSPLSSHGHGGHGDSGSGGGHTSGMARTSSSTDSNKPHSVVPWTIADRTSQAAKRAARSAAFPLRYTSSHIDQNATEKGNHRCYIHSMSLISLYVICHVCMLYQ
jgi:hypothetical protein